MKLTKSRSTIKFIDSNDPLFVIRDGDYLAKRAGFKINPHAPAEYKRIIFECIDNGWLTPVAYMTNKEIVLAGLSNSK
jgi:hypothetical protein